MRTYRKFQDVLIDELRDDPAQAYTYLQVALEEFDQDGDTEQLMLALRNVAAGRGAGAGASGQYGPDKPLQSIVRKG